MTSLGYISVSGCRPSLSLLESLTYSREEVRTCLPSLMVLSGASAAVVLSTCQRVEVYATWDGPANPAALLRALSADRGVPLDILAQVAISNSGEKAAEHLLRVATGLESFVLGEAEIAGQVRTAAEASRSSGAGGLVLDRLMAAAISTSRRAHRHTSMGASARSVASAGMTLATELSGGVLAGRRVLVVGAGEVAATVVEHATALGARVTVCNRTRRHADRFIAAGAAVVDLAELTPCLARADVAVLATAAPHWLVDAATLRSRGLTGTPIVLVDLALPRNVDPAVRAVAGVTLVDLADLRASGSQDARLLVEDVATAEQVVREELARYQRWLVRRSAARAIRQLRADVRAIADLEVARTTGGMPAELRAMVEEAIGRVVGQLAHGPTQELLAAAEAGDPARVDLLAGLFGRERSVPALLGPGRVDDAGAAAARTEGLPFDPEVGEVNALHHAAHQSTVHAADELTMFQSEVREDAVAE
jgi:glutamyl-tRNA reductase